MIILLFILLAIISIGLFLWQFSNLISVFYGSPYVMMDKIVIREALKLANLKKGEIFYDLGCGNGDVLIEAAKMGAKATGFEISPYYYIYAKLKTQAFKNIKVKYRDINKVDFSKADVIYCYLLPEFLKKLASKFRKEMKKSSRLISVGFPIPMLKNEIVSSIDKHKIFIYKF